MSASLFVYTRRGPSLAEALTDFGEIAGDGPAAALLFSPRRCTPAAWEAGSLVGPDGRPTSLDDAFEARLFSESVELRWLNDPSAERRHRAVMLSEQALSPMHAWETETIAVIATLPQTYLVWGEGTGRPMNGRWSELATARIGPLYVPIPNAGKNARVLLRTVEYVTEADHGNAVVFDERLVKLEVARG